MPYLSAFAVVIHYEEALYQVYAPLPLPLPEGFTLLNVRIATAGVHRSGEGRSSRKLTGY